MGQKAKNAGKKKTVPSSGKLANAKSVKYVGSTYKGKTCVGRIYLGTDTKPIFQDYSVKQQQVSRGNLGFVDFIQQNVN